MAMPTLLIPCPPLIAKVSLQLRVDMCHLANDMSWKTIWVTHVKDIFFSNERIGAHKSQHSLSLPLSVYLSHLLGCLFASCLALQYWEDVMPGALAAISFLSLIHI